MKRKKRKQQQSYAKLKRKDKINMICGVVFYIILIGIVIFLFTIALKN